MDGEGGRGGGGVRQPTNKEFFKGPCCLFERGLEAGSGNTANLKNGLAFLSQKRPKVGGALQKSKNKKLPPRGIGGCVSQKCAFVWHLAT